MRIIKAQSPEDIADAHQLFEEYAVGLDISLCFQNFDKELADLPGQYAPPGGRLLLAFINDELAGCVALRDLGRGACEMKRLYLRPAFRGQGLGRMLAEAIINEGRQMGYHRMCLETLPGRMDPAIAMYQAFGFKEIPPYYDNPVEGAKFMELSLA